MLCRRTRWFSRVFARYYGTNVPPGVAVTNNIIDLVARGSSAPLESSWRSLSVGTDYRAPVIPKSVDIQERDAESDENARFDAVGIESMHDADMTDRVFYEPGGYVESNRANTKPLHGVVLGEGYQPRSRKWRVLVLTDRGECCPLERDEITFFAPRLVSRDLAHRAGIFAGPENATEHAARVAILKQLRILNHHLERAASLFNPNRIDIYAAFRSLDPYAWSAVTLSEALALVKPTAKIPDIVTVISTHRHLIRNPRHFLIDPLYRVNETFLVRPKSHVDRIERVEQWATQKVNSPIDKFVVKARRITQISEDLRQKQLREHPSQVLLRDVQPWTKEDLDIISLITHANVRFEAAQANPYSLALTTIMRRVYPELEAVDDHTAHSLLSQIGALAPWQDLLSVTHLAASQKVQKETVPIVDRFLAEQVKSVTSSATTGQVLGPTDFHLKDPLGSVRHDWGNLPVYIIDDPDAKELDDGISIERIPGDPESFWCHSHIADPASLIHKDHIFAEHAAKNYATSYYMSGVAPMLPKALGHSQIPGMTLYASGDKETPQRVLTFSARVRSDGEVIDCCVRAGLIRNAKRFTYDGVDLALGGKIAERWYPLGVPNEFKGHLAQREVSPRLTPEEQTDLQNLSKVSSWISQKKFKEGVYVSTSPASDIHLAGEYSALPVPTWYDPSSPVRKTPSVFTGMVPMLMTVHSGSYAITGARGLVGQMMMLAGRVASRFLLQHDVPGLRRFIAPPIPISDSAAQEILDARDPETLFVDTTFVTPRTVMLSTGGYSISPLAHFMIGASEGEGYVRATSPLRRYNDLVTHWQLHAVLLKQSIPFNETALAQLGQYSIIADREHGRRGGLHNLSWRYSAIKRYFDLQLARNPNFEWIWDAVVVSPPSVNDSTGVGHYSVFVPELGLKFLVDDLELDFLKVIEMGMEIKVKPTVVRFGPRPAMILSPVR
ncbi:hypothetical protein DL96DRAFT_1489279 [Flagelloscypha sp. PMI_526]|nr:hypothetical protein DL96DRAFT_1489279 [Flagelloscypha sp. PMI_526]